MGRIKVESRQFRGAYTVIASLSNSPEFQTVPPLLQRIQGISGGKSGRGRWKEASRGAHIVIASTMAQLAAHLVASWEGYKRESEGNEEVGGGGCNCHCWQPPWVKFQPTC